MLIRKSKKNKKNQIYKKKKLRDQVWKPNNIFTYKYRSPQHTQEGGQFCTFGGSTKNPNPKNPSLSNQSVAPLGKTKRAAAPPLVLDFLLPCLLPFSRHLLPLTIAPPLTSQGLSFPCSLAFPPKASATLHSTKENQRAKSF
jgi:hypothetical protein